MSAGVEDAPAVSGPPAREDDGALWARSVRRVSVFIFVSERCSVVAKALKESVMELRGYEDARMSE
jgi:hypothetical protein